MSLNYGKAFRIFRAILGLTQKDLAEALTYDPSSISLIENNERNPGRDLILKLCDLVDVPTDVFFVISGRPIKDESDYESSGFALIHAILKER